MVKRRAEKLCGATVWFRKSPRKEKEQTTTGGRQPRAPRGPEKPNESVMFVPQTQDSRLKRSLQKAEESLIGKGKLRYGEQRLFNLKKMDPRGRSW